MQDSHNNSKRKAEGGLEDKDRLSKISKSNVSLSSNSSNQNEKNLFDDSQKNTIPSSRILSKAEKVASLLRSLEDVLDDEGVDVVSENEVINCCTNLRTALLKSKYFNDPTTAGEKPSHTSKPANVPNIGRLILPSDVTPWKSSAISSTPPKLPKILDPTLAAAAFVHTSIGGGHTTDLSYERLEWIGDAYIELISTLLIAQTFPFLSSGKTSQLREGLVKNETLARYGRIYGFDKRLKIDDRSLGFMKSKAHELIKVQGDVFEAYVAAVILSDPVNGVQQVVEWLRGLWGQDLKNDIVHEERTNFKYDSPIWRLRGNVAKITVTDRQQNVPLSFKDQLQKLLGAKGIKLRYEDVGGPQKNERTKLTVFTVALFIDGWGEQGRLLGTGKGGGKKEAGERAAEIALQNKRLIASYVEKKRLFHAQAELEKQALEKLNAA